MKELLRIIIIILIVATLTALLIFSAERLFFTVTEPQQELMDNRPTY